MPELTELTPMLAVPDVAQAAGFFEQKLGFEILFVMNEPGMSGYASVQRGCFLVSFLEGEVASAPGAKGGLNLVVDDVDAVYREFEKRGAFAPGFPVQHDAIREHPPEDKPYGMRDFLFVEPNGYLVIVGQPLDGD